MIISDYANNQDVILILTFKAQERSAKRNDQQQEEEHLMALFMYVL